MITPTERDELELQEVACIKLIRQLADLNQDGDPVDGKALVMDNDGAYRILQSLISQARAILGMPDRLPVAGPTDFNKAEKSRDGMGHKPGGGPPTRDIAHVSGLAEANGSPSI
jgi:hypothetical protein